MATVSLERKTLFESLYGLKISSRCWNTAFQEFMEQIQFQQSTADPCIYVKKTDNEISILAIYVDDLIVMASTSEEMK